MKMTLTEYGRNFRANDGLNTLKITTEKDSTLTLFSDLTVSAQQDVVHCGVKDETHVLQKALFGKKKCVTTAVTVSVHILATLAYYRSDMHLFSIPTYSYSSMHWETV